MYLLFCQNVMSKFLCHRADMYHSCPDTLSNICSEAKRERKLITMVTANILRRKRSAHCRWDGGGLENKARTVLEPVQQWHIDPFKQTARKKVLNIGALSGEYKIIAFKGKSTDFPECLQHKIYKESKWINSGNKIFISIDNFHIKLGSILYNPQHCYYLCRDYSSISILNSGLCTNGFWLNLIWWN
jgi:hypothetical protein